MTDCVELAVIGAGPAGLEAAIAAAESGVNVILIDSAVQAGGQYFRQPPGSFEGTVQTSAQKKGQALLHRLEQAGGQLLLDTVVWGIFPAADSEGWLLALHGPQAPPQMQANTLILATGAYDRPIPFPGWTLPGVMTTGAAQTLLKSQQLLPGKRVLLSGTGPLQLAAAAQLVKAGAEVVAVLEGTPIKWWQALRHAPVMWGQWARLQEGWDYWRTLRRAGVNLRVGWSVVEARGDGELQEVTIAQLNNMWQPIDDSRQTLCVDTLLIGYGFIPATQLSRLLGCLHDFKPARGGYVPRRNDYMQTSLSGVYAVGDGAGIGGAALSQVEGRVVGLSAARQVGRLDEQTFSTEMTRLQPALAREQRFAHMLGNLFTPGPGLYTLAKPDTIICRCEEISLAEIKEAVAGGAQNINEVKGLTRVGMGNCQGRICAELVAWAMLDGADTSEYLKQVEAVGILSVRPPIYPLPLSSLAEAAEEVT